MERLRVIVSPAPLNPPEDIWLSTRTVVVISDSPSCSPFASSAIAETLDQEPGVVRIVSNPFFDTLPISWKRPLPELYPLNIQAATSVAPFQLTYDTVKLDRPVPYRKDFIAGDSEGLPTNGDLYAR